MSDAETEDRAIDKLYEEIDDLLLAGKFDEVNARLLRVKPGELEPLIALGWLTITFAAKHKLSNRSVYYDRVEMNFYSRFPAKRAKKLLDGLE